MPEHDTLPLPDYDHLPVSGLASRIRTLDRPGLQTLLEYERRHANRLQVVTITENRLTELEQGAQPSGGDPAGPTPEAPPGVAAGSKVSEATTGPAVNPPTGGDPTNPTQPR